MHSSTNGREITGQSLRETYRLQDVGIYNVQASFLLTEADFIHLNATNIWGQRIATIFLGAVIGNSVSLSCKIIASMTDGNGSVTFLDAVRTVNRWEIFALVISLFLMGLSFGLGAMLPSKKKTVLRKIKKHFEDNPNVGEIRRKSR